MAFNPYALMRQLARIKSARLRLLGAWVCSVTQQRYFGLFLDPVLACNLRCQMCYFSDEAQRERLRGRLSMDELHAIAEVFFSRAIKLQIGCGAEPTLFTSLPKLVALGKQYRVPYISITTNGQLLSADLLKRLVDAGLDEVTLSLHGLTQQTYEELMQGASFEQFEQTIAILAQATKQSPHLRIRINYTMNAKNIEELSLLPALLERLPATVVQLRPVQKLGDTAWTDFSLDNLRASYSELLPTLTETLAAKGITLLYPSLEDINDWDKSPTPAQQALQDLTYCNIDPHTPQPMMLPRLDISRLWHSLMGVPYKSEEQKKGLTKKMAYHIQ